MQYFNVNGVLLKIWMQELPENWPLVGSLSFSVRSFFFPEKPFMHLFSRLASVFLPDLITADYSFAL
jgi:hypothetical protein